MSSRTLPASHNTLAALVAFLYAEIVDGARNTYEIHGGELPVGWVPGTAVLVVPDGGSASINVPELVEGFTCHSYGTSLEVAQAVDLAVFNVLHRPIARTAVVGSDTFYLTFAERTAGPIWSREPETEWARWISTYTVVFAEWKVQA